ncbi:hypothetical protein N5D37_05755 [Comamonas aquatica]|uniref:hypothetical protein n=1 Tax=Comamonas aquatica TaxID=225991 RepID=UPI00244CEDF2|nr:hypothetical protein [Comamonas aquatica]MDH1765210.1 hypothetical protein [Comamonas aquatica]
MTEATEAVQDGADGTPQEAPEPTVAPSVEDTMLRLRLDDDLLDDVTHAIPQAVAEAESILERRLYASEADMEAAGDLRGLVIRPDITAAMLLLIDASVGANASKDAETKRQRAEMMLLRYAYRGV